MSKQKQHASLDTSLVTKGVHCTSAVKKKQLVLNLDVKMFVV